MEEEDEEDFGKWQSKFFFQAGHTYTLGRSTTSGSLMFSIFLQRNPNLKLQWANREIHSPKSLQFPRKDWWEELVPMHIELAEGMKLWPAWLMTQLWQQFHWPAWTQNIACLSISDPDDAARKQQLNATAKNLLLRYGFSRESVLCKEGAGASGAAGGAVAPKPKPGRRTALSQAQRDLIKGGAMISRVRSGHPS